MREENMQQQNVTIRYDLHNMNAVAQFLVDKNNVFRERGPKPVERALADLQKAVHKVIADHSFDTLKHNMMAGILYLVDGHSGVLLHLHITENKRSITAPALISHGSGDSGRFQNEVRQSTLLESGIEFEPSFYMHPGKGFVGQAMRLNIA